MARGTRTAPSGRCRPILQQLRSRNGQTHETTQCPGLPNVCCLRSQWGRTHVACCRCALPGWSFLLPSDHLGSQGLESRWSESRVTLSAKDIKAGKQDTAGYSCLFLNMSCACGSPAQFIPLALFSFHPIKHPFNSEGKKKSIKRKKRSNNEFLTYCPKQKAGPGADPWLASSDGKTSKAFSWADCRSLALKAVYNEATH